MHESHAGNWYHPMVWRYVGSDGQASAARVYVASSLYVLNSIAPNSQARRAGTVLDNSDHTQSQSHRYVIGCDIGGTFTDFVLYDAHTQRYYIDKRLTTPADPGAAVLSGVDGFCGAGIQRADATDRLVHGTTLGINALLERKGARTAMLVTRGFRDILELRRGTRGELWDLSGRLPEPLVERSLRFEIDERIDSAGHVIVPLDADQVRAALDRCAAAGAGVVAVCLLHAYQNPQHETTIRELARESHPQIGISLSSDVLPQLGEYERFSATVANAYLRPVMERYLPTLEGALRARGLRDGGLRLLSSEGSQCSTEVAQAYPIRVVESGPVGGVLAARHFGQATGTERILTLDIGGTTAKTCLMEGSELPIAEEYEVARVYRFRPGSGLPLNVPSVDLLEVGAGGGSIAWIGPLGMVEIGPESAGASPGPACYANGGHLPTVTDADVVLGLLDPASFRAVSRPVDRALAERAIREHLAEPLGISVADAALRIRQVATEKMASAIALQLAHVGTDARELTMIAFGGAGPLYASDLARRLGIVRVVVPPMAAVFSALGMVIAPAAYTVVRSFVAGLEALAARELEAAMQSIETVARDAVASDAHEFSASVGLARQVELRYRGQGRSLRVPIGQVESNADMLRLIEDFHARYASRFGAGQPDQAVQMTAIRVTATLPAAAPPTLGREESSAGSNAVSARRMVMAGTSDEQMGVVIGRAGMCVGDWIDGPAVVEDAGSTAFVGAGARCSLDGSGALIIEMRENDTEAVTPSKNARSAS